MVFEMFNISLRCYCCGKVMSVRTTSANNIMLYDYFLKHLRLLLEIKVDFCYTPLSWGYGYLILMILIIYVVLETLDSRSPFS
jgi:hypothetical protein